MECELCGGTNFIKEFGYFYCSECQTQSQEIREHVFQEEGNINVKSAKKIKAKDEKPVQNLTSWECYNVVLYSLTKQLIDLGANQLLKRVVKCLWLRYLEKLEVLNTSYDAIPKLQIINSRRDAHIILKKKKKKRKRKASSSSDDLTSVSSLRSSSVKRQITKKKTALVHSHYEEVSQLISQDSSSLHNETLLSIKDESNKSSIYDDKLRYNIYSINEMKKTMSKNHLQKHKIFNDELTCHQQIISDVYKQGVHYISPIKLYSLLYLGLLITKDKLQLSDLLRFIREGHLCFNNYIDVFPEDQRDKLLNITNNNKNGMFSSSSIRAYTAKLAKFLNATGYITVPDCTDLCRRYCKEMNLPDEILRSVENIVSKTVPKLAIKNQDCIPNYEGRIMALLLFTLKLLFGFDGVTEFHFSKFAKCVNETHQLNSFDIISWLKYLAYRKLQIEKHHFPSFYINNDSEVNSDQLLQYSTSQDISFVRVSNLTREMADFEEILLKIKELQQYDTNIETAFPASVTPFMDYYSQIERRSKARFYFDRSYSNDEIDFLIRPNKYLGNAKVINGGANDRWVIEKIKKIRNIKNFQNLRHKLELIEIITKGEDVLENDDETNGVIINNDPSEVQKNYHKYRKHIFEKNSKYLARTCRFENLNGKSEMDSYDTHYNPFERYWLNCIANINWISKKTFDAFFQNHTFTFKVLFNECSRIIEQSQMEFFKEFQSTELFLTYSPVFLGKDSCRAKGVLDTNLKCCVQQAIEQW